MEEAQKQEFLLTISALRGNIEAIVKDCSKIKNEVDGQNYKDMGWYKNVLFIKNKYEQTKNYADEIENKSNELIKIIDSELDENNKGIEIQKKWSELEQLFNHIVKSEAESEVMISEFNNEIEKIGKDLDEKDKSVRKKDKEEIEKLVNKGFKELSNSFKEFTEKYNAEIKNIDKKIEENKIDFNEAELEKRILEDINEDITKIVENTNKENLERNQGFMNEMSKKFYEFIDYIKKNVKFGSENKNPDKDLVKEEEIVKEKVDFVVDDLYKKMSEKTKVPSVGNIKDLDCQKLYDYYLNETNNIQFNNDFNQMIKKVITEIEEKIFSENFNLKTYCIRMFLLYCSVKAFSKTIVEKKISYNKDYEKIIFKDKIQQEIFGNTFGINNVELLKIILNRREKEVINFIQENYIINIIKNISIQQNSNTSDLDNVENDMK